MITSNGFNRIQLDCSHQGIAQKSFNITLKIRVENSFHYNWKMLRMHGTVLERKLWLTDNFEDIKILIEN